MEKEEVYEWTWRLKDKKRWLGYLDGLLPPVLFISSVIFPNFCYGSDLDFSMDLVDDNENFTEEILF